MGIRLETKEGIWWEILAHAHQTPWRIVHSLIRRSRQNWGRDCDWPGFSCNLSGSRMTYHRVIRKLEQNKHFLVQFYDCRADAHRAHEHRKLGLIEETGHTGEKRWMWTMPQSSHLTFLHTKDWHLSSMYALEFSRNHKAIIAHFFKFCLCKYKTL